MMANSLLEICNQWQIQRSEILARNSDMDLTIQKLDMMIEYSVRSAIDIAHRVDWDFREAAVQAAKVSGE